jgi:hypothetical protein
MRSTLARSSPQEAQRPRHRPVMRAAALLASALVIAGCESTGLSVRDTRGQGYGEIVHASPPTSTADYDVDDSNESGATLQRATAGGAEQAAAVVAASTAAGNDASDRAKTATAPGLRIPISVAVVQVGEVAPQGSLINTLAKDKAHFARVDPIPWPADAPQFRESADVARERARRQREQLRSMTRQMGADYLFVVGGTLDQATTNTPLSALDLTIVGMFVVPSRNLTGEARAGGTLIDARSDRNVLSVSADAHEQRLSPAAALKDDQLKLAVALRDQMMTQLGHKLRDRIAAIPATGG